MKEIPLPRGMFAIVDDDDYGWLSKHKWCINGGGYAARNIPKKDRINGKKTQITMHREIMQLSGLGVCDHINGNIKDNRKANLRIANPLKNQWNKRKPKSNTSGYKGVSIAQSGKGWLAQIKIHGKHKHIGTYDTKEEAAMAYDNQAIIHFGEFARLNFGGNDNG